MERRQTPRVRLELPVDQIVADEDLGRARTTDVSAEGVRIEPLAGECLLDTRFAWLVLRLPESAPAGDTIRALAERRPGEAGERAGQSYRIKYIYPRDRRRFEAFVREAVGG